MPRVKVDTTALQEFLDAGHSQADAALHFGVSQAAISQRVKQARIATSKVVALERAAQVVDQKLTAAQRLQHVQRVILDELTWAEQQAKQPGVDRAALSDVIVKLSGEVRAQLRLKHDISRALIDLRVVREFQRTVFETIQEESPEAAHRIIARLKAQQALRRSAELPTLDGGGGFGVA
jgi:predicted transcriptional regulator